MEKICNLTLQPVTKSPWMQLLQVKYTQNNIKRTWDIMQSHDSCAILVHNINRDVFVFVRQFRPAVYLSLARKYHEVGSPINENIIPLSQGFTMELCAGILDKKKPVEEIAAEEVLEECGYKIPAGDLEKINVSRYSTGRSGSEQTMYYAKVEDSMKVGTGGGNLEEGEMVEIVEIPVKDTLDFAMNSVEKPVGLAFALFWFHLFKRKAIQVPAVPTIVKSVNDAILKSKMENVCDVSIHPITESRWIRPERLSYTQNDMPKNWDVLHSHDSCSVLLHNITRDVFVFVRQFRPAVYINYAHSIGEDGPLIDISKVPIARGFTMEVCAGLLDKDDKSVEETAVEEVFEECGYKISTENLEKIIATRSSVGIRGSRETIFYARVTDDMKVGTGGGNCEEGEMIELVEVPVANCLSFALDGREKPTGTSFALLWFYYFKVLESQHS